MSYEGYRNYRCVNGHIDRVDVYDEQPSVCMTCGGKLVAFQPVDQTNGHDEYPWREIKK